MKDSKNRSKIVRGRDLTHFQQKHHKLTKGISMFCKICEVRIQKRNSSTSLTEKLAKDEGIIPQSHLKFTKLNKTNEIIS